MYNYLILKVISKVATNDTGYWIEVLMDYIFSKQNGSFFIIHERFLTT